MITWTHQYQSLPIKGLKLVNNSKIDFALPVLEQAIRIHTKKPVSLFILKYLFKNKYWLPVLIPPPYNIRNTFNYVVSTKKIQQKQRNILNNSEPNAGLPKEQGKRHTNAKDAQDILPSKAPLGKETTGHHNKHKAKRPGRARGKRSMGRYPFLTELERYLKDSEGFKAKSTISNERRMLRNLHGDIQYLHASKQVSTTNPKNITEDDIKVLIRYLKTRENKDTGGNLNNDTVAKYMQYLQNILNWCGNSAMARIKMRGQFPKRSTRKEIITLDEEDSLFLFDKSQKMEGWNGDVTAFIIPTYIIMGLRASELTRAEFKDVNTRKWTFFIRYPKGGQAYQKTVNIPRELTPYFERYLEARQRELNQRGLDNVNTLIPRFSKLGMKDQPYTAAYFWRLKRDLEEIAGITFSYQMLRRTSGQLLKDGGEDIETVSKHLRHSSTMITERHYARMRDNKANQIIDDFWSQSSFAGKSARNTQIAD